MAGFIFGGNTGETPESLKRKREIANALAMSAVGHAPRNIGEGLSSIGQALAYRAIAGKADKAAAAGQESANAAFNPIVAALGGGGAFPAAPGAPSNVDVPTQRVASAFGDQPGPANGYFDAIRSAESGGSDNAKNPLSSATGRYQFTKGTWDGLMTAHPELGLTPDGRIDPSQQERAIRVFTAQNANQLQDAGIQPTGGNLYAAHFLGADGAKNVLTQPDTAAVSSFVGPEVVKANPFLRGMTVGQFKQWAASKGGGDAPVAFSENVPAESSVAMSAPPTNAPSQAPNGAPGQLPDAEALKLLGASPITRDAQGGPSIATLLRSAANPWLSKNQSAVVSALLQEKLKQQDPTTQLDMRYKQAQLNALENPTKAPTVQQFYDLQTGQPYEAQWNPKTKAWDKVGGNKASSNGITVSPDGTVQIGGPTKPLTEAQSKDAVFFTRGAGALPTLDQFGNALTSLPEAVGGNAPVVGNYLKSKEYQQASQAGKEFLQAILRKDTGAAITKEETAEYGSVYLPQPGDGPEVLAQKKAARHRALAAIKIGLPPMAILGMEKAGVDLGQGELPKAPKKPVVIDGYTIEQVE